MMPAHRRPDAATRESDEMQTLAQAAAVAAIEAITLDPEVGTVRAAADLAEMRFHAWLDLPAFARRQFPDRAEQLRAEHEALRTEADNLTSRELRRWVPSRREVDRFAVQWVEA